MQEDTYGNGSKKCIPGFRRKVFLEQLEGRIHSKTGRFFHHWIPKLRYLTERYRMRFCEQVRQAVPCNQKGFFFRSRWWTPKYRELSDFLYFNDPSLVQCTSAKLIANM